jgi:hypothetical protein
LADPTSQEHEFYIQAASGDRVKVVCPVCRNDKFLTSGPPPEARAGFRHVVMGLTGRDSLSATPVKFQHCANCGYIVQFMISRTDKEEPDVV